MLLFFLLSQEGQIASQCPCLQGWVLDALRRGPAIYWQENLAPAAAGNPRAIFGLGMAWSRLGHGLGMTSAEMLLQNLGLLGSCGGSTKGFGLKEMMQNDSGWCSPPT